MNRIEIIHNPFTVDTQFLINGLPPAQGCKLSSYKETRLQGWVERLFDELAQLFNGDERYAIVFTGVESDYLDIAEAAQTAIARGAEVTLEWNKTAPSEQRLDDIRALMEHAKGNPEFRRYMENTEGAEQSFIDAFNRDFDVFVVATMSSGKSTLINAMLGRDLLPAANEATTATIARIADNESIGDRFKADCYDKRGELLARIDDVQPGMIAEWNVNREAHLIDIQGDIKGIRERLGVRLVLTDTPGPNNSQDKGHQLTTMGFITDSKRNPLILYVLNATQLGTNDDRNLLGMIAETMKKGGKQSKDRFIFVINKMDEFDPSHEDIPSVLKRVSKYLADNGIHNPLIYPVSANLTRLLRKAPELHTRKEQGFLYGAKNLFEAEPAMDMLQYMPITARVKRNLLERGLSEILLKSGLPAVEGMIDEYIDKYNFPHRVKRAYDALLKTLDTGLTVAEIEAQLDADQKTLNRVQEEIETLKERQEKGFETAALRDKLKLEGLGLPDDVKEKLEVLQLQPEEILRELREELIGDKSPNEANSLINDAERRIRFEYDKLIDTYERLFETAQDLIRSQLHEKYERHVADLFQASRALDLPIFAGLEKTVSELSLNLTIKDKDIKTRSVLIGSREVSDSTWYKPLSWFRKKTVYDYRDEKYVDLAELWSERLSEVRGALTSLVRNGRDEIASMKEKLTDRFVEFVSEEFDSKFDEILSELQEKLAESDKREQAIEKARRQKAWIATFKTKLDQTLAV